MFLSKKKSNIFAFPIPYSELINISEYVFTKNVVTQNIEYRYNIYYSCERSNSIIYNNIYTLTSGSAKNSRGVSPPRVAALLMTRPPTYPLTNITTHVPSIVRTRVPLRTLTFCPPLAHVYNVYYGHTQTHTLLVLLLL